MHQLKQLARGIAGVIAGNDALWNPFAKTVVRGSQFLCSVRDIHEADEIVARHARLHEAFAPAVVLAGPFQGMKYGSTQAFCSALHPKLLGAYENEIAGLVSTAIRANYDTLVDVGAADGYYAVGFALKSPNIRVIAFEQDPRAQAEFAKLAAANGISGGLDVRGKCEPADLLAINAAPGLMIVDCEGYEDPLLNPEVIRHFKDWDFIIETHDGFSPGITDRLEQRFTTTHETRRVEVIHDLDKADHFDLPLLKGLPRREVNRLLAENRQHACLRWLACSSKSAPRRDA